MKLIILVFALGFCVGVLANELLRLIQRSYGTLRIDHSNPEKDIYRIELDSLDDISKKKVIVLKVDNNANLSQN